ncbi:putative O-glycosylation ligase, exosortase A system-associated [Alteromonas sp. Cnat2-8]|uniref:putative O-glycosylation ligase, exosortase A system-associated n=1 Tax=Alteromonas sp. Cnat2-8 TaxID=2917728 RepID=UPI001EF5D7B4|nr:putative O-glycosylation ligase, exosortase A system-associated [Alteromonas sp. Cnat2-8]MCG7653279.1 putative O-glycosylation ligase, exosortase A system-associated [Alteromonas sp. Cnat2-8]
MVTDIFMSLILLALMFYSFTRPHVAACLAVWINLVKPQNTSFAFLAGQPLSLITTALFFLVLIFNFNKLRIPKSKSYHFIMIGFMVWVTIASFLGEYQNVVWIKYDFVIKTLIFAYFIPFTLTKRAHVEMFLWICVASFGLFLFMAGIKTLLGGGGYGVSLIGIGGFMYSEGSTLASLAVCLIPLFVALKSSSKIAQSWSAFRWLSLAYSALSLLTVVGTQARTGLVALAAYIGLLLKKHKINFKVFLAICMIPLLIYTVAPKSWFYRMSSIEDATTSEKSAIGRIVVWRWTLDYVSHRPFFGGGFYSYNANAGILHHYQQGDEIEIKQRGGKAFHNIFFEVLGETGYGGLFLFLSILLHTILLNRRTIKRLGGEVGVIGGALSHSLIIYCVGGLFIGVAFYPWIYYLYGVSLALSTVEES